jgi:hypothetical protein
MEMYKEQNHNMTRQTLYEGVSEAGTITVNTSGWKPGVYVAVANVGGKTVTQKFAITK